MKLTIQLHPQCRSDAEFLEFYSATSRRKRPGVLQRCLVAGSKATTFPPGLFEKADETAKASECRLSLMLDDKDREDSELIQRVHLCPAVARAHLKRTMLLAGFERSRKGEMETLSPGDYVDRPVGPSAILDLTQTVNEKDPRRYATLVGGV